MQKTKTQNGITLIALIITIIVMLILVAVTLVITLGDNGIIAKAREAKLKTDKRIEGENSELGANAEDGIDALVEEGTPWNLNTSGEENGGDDQDLGDWVLLRAKEEEMKIYYYAENEFTTEVLNTIEIHGVSLEFCASEYGFDVVYVSDEVTPSKNDDFFYLNDDYTYSFSSDGWSVGVKDRTKEKYGELQSNILGVNVTSIKDTFDSCSSMTVAPVIPASIVISCNNAFYGCSKLREVTYAGTLEQFKSIPSYKGIGANGLVVHCSDGDYTVGE